MSLPEFLLTGLIGGTLIVLTLRVIQAVRLAWRDTNQNGQIDDDE